MSVNFLCIYFGCLVCFVLFLKQSFPVALIKLDLHFMEHLVGYRLDSVFDAFHLRVTFLGQFGKHSTEMQCGKPEGLLRSCPGISP